MKNFSTTIGVVWGRIWMAALLALGLSACGLIGKTSLPPTAFYTLEGVPVPTTQPVLAAAPGATLTLIVNPPRAASGFDSQRIVYVREDHQLEYFAQSEWVDSPARMLGPLLVTAAQQTGAFAAVVLASGTAAGDLRLTVDIQQLQHNFQTTPSRVQLTLRTYLTDEKTRRVLAWKEFHAEAVAASENPQGGVVAANRVVQDVLAQVAQFLVERPR
jgi:cholesterol transport system auxiliary component